MSTSRGRTQSQEPAAERSHEYVVVARRYRPQTFEDLIGQEHVAKALSNAIASHRVGHAYLFTGARGVGKTSAARILAKALNCLSGPTATPCNQCDVCEAISTGDDVDVLEIDGASNRGIDEIRQLRQNVNVRPSRERFKIYIIDEVHMLTREAFNALLKTLEEPPEHVKFIFCTTEPIKIPVTILSRCQRFDFAGIQTAAIVKRLEQIVATEGVSAEPEALQLLARRAAGSMRDSQSLLEQLLAFAPTRIAVADVNAMLGIAGGDRMARLVRHLVGGDAASSLAELDAAIQEGVDPGLLVEQLFGFYRDMMAMAAGCSGDLLLHVTPDLWQEVGETARKLGLENVLAVMQILDQTLSRLRYSTQARILAELALVHIAAMGDLAELSEAIAQLGSAAEPARAPQRPVGSVSSPAQGEPVKKKGPEVTTPQGAAAYYETTESEPPAATDLIPLVPENATRIWTQATAKVPGLVGEHAGRFYRAAIRAPNHLVVSFPEEYTFSRSLCDAPDQRARFEQALAEVTGQRLKLEFETVEEKSGPAKQSPSTRSKSVQQLRNEVAQHPMVHRAIELFGAFPERIDGPEGGGP
jgi:DNA polymerase III subunit gamma/tau